MALRRSTRNSRAIMALNVLSRVGRGTGASAISAAMSAADGPPPAPADTGAAVVVVVIVYSRYSRPVRVRNTVSRLGFS